MSTRRSVSGSRWSSTPSRGPCACPPTCAPHSARTTRRGRRSRSSRSPIGASTSSGSRRPSGPRRARAGSPRRSSASPKRPAALMARLHGAIAAASTPLADGGARLDDDAFAPYADFLVGAGLDGVLAFGTNGEAVLLTPDERRRGLERWLEAIAGRVLVAAHCGAQTHAGHGRAGGARGGGGRRRRGSDRAAVLQARRARHSVRTCSRRRRPARRCRSTSTSSPRPPATRSTRRCSRGSARRRTTSSG